MNIDKIIEYCEKQLILNNKSLNEKYCDDIEFVDILNNKIVSFYCKKSINNKEDSFEKFNIDLSDKNKAKEYLSELFNDGYEFEDTIKFN